MNVLWVKLKYELLLWDIGPARPPSVPYKHITYQADSRLEQHDATRNIKVRDSAPAVVLSNGESCFMFLSCRQSC